LAECLRLAGLVIHFGSQFSRHLAPRILIVCREFIVITKYCQFDILAETEGAK